MNVLERECLSSSNLKPLVNANNEMEIGDNPLLDGSSFIVNEKLECDIKKEVLESDDEHEMNAKYRNSHSIQERYDAIYLPYAEQDEVSETTTLNYLGKPLEEKIKLEFEDPQTLENGECLSLYRFKTSGNMKNEIIMGDNPLLDEIKKEQEGSDEEHQNYLGCDSIQEDLQGDYDFPNSPCAKQHQISYNEHDGCEEDSDSINKYDMFDESEDRIEISEVTETRCKSSIDDATAKSLKRIHCQFCEYTASVRGRMKEHIDAVHLRVKNYKCEHCDFTTSTNRNLKKHIRAVHNKLRNHKCGHCDYTAYAFTTLKKHIMAVHEKIKSFKCDQCDFSAAFNRDLQRHIDNIHRKIKNHNCEHCDYATYYSSCFKNHINTVHHNLKKFKCKHCEHAANSHADIARHIDSVHHKVRNYKCEHCDFAAGSSSNLNRHIRAIHQKIKTKCEYCNFSTSQITNLKRHIRVVHCK